ncbi:MAG TPA: DinB family protein [Bryobacteraceae bacterium]|jgi:hypothetical protein
MEKQERQVIIDQLNASRDRLLGLVDWLTAEQWEFRPAADRWSINQCLEHVTRVERRVLGNIEKKLRDEAPEPEKRDPKHEKDAVVAQALPDRSIPRSAPEPVQPVGEWPDAAELLAAFGATRRRTTEFTASTPGDLRSYFIPHGAFGDLDCYQWLIALSLHGARHAEQIEEIRAAPGFPRATASPASA